MEFIRGLIAAHPTEHRRSPSKIFCPAWNWKQENGALRDTAARGLMLALHRASQIELPPVRSPALGQSARRRVPAVRGIDFIAAAIDVQHEAHTGRPNAPSRGIRAIALSRSMPRNS